MEEKEQIKKQSDTKFTLIILALLVLIVMVIVVSMATLTYTKETDNVNRIQTGNISLNFTEDNNGINITNAFPMSDALGKKLTDENQYFDFTLNATMQGKARATYEIAALKKNNSTLENNEVKLYLEKKVGNSYQEVMAPQNFTPLIQTSNIGTPAGSMVLIRKSVSQATSTNYRLRMWVDENAMLSQESRTFSIQVMVNAKVEA